MVVIRHTRVAWDRNKIKILFESMLPKLIEDAHRLLAESKLDVKGMLGSEESLRPALRLLRKDLGALVRSSVYEKGGDELRCASLALLVSALSEKAAQENVQSEFWD